MSLIAILGALLLEQIFPLSSYTRLRLWLRNAIDYVERALAMDQVKPWQTFWFITLIGGVDRWVAEFCDPRDSPFAWFAVDDWGFIFDHWHSPIQSFL